MRSTPGPGGGGNPPGLNVVFCSPWMQDQVICLRFSHINKLSRSRSLFTTEGLQEVNREQGSTDGLDRSTDPVSLLI